MRIRLKSSNSVFLLRKKITVLEDSNIKPLFQNVIHILQLSAGPNLIQKQILKTFSQSRPMRSLNMSPNISMFNYCWWRQILNMKKVHHHTQEPWLFTIYNHRENSPQINHFPLQKEVQNSASVFNKCRKGRMGL